jgi:hypothetical protein
VRAEYWGTILLDDDGQPRVYVASTHGPLRGRNLSIGPFWSPTEAEYATTFIWNAATRLVGGRRRWCAEGWARAHRRYGECLRDWEGLMPAELRPPVDRWDAADHGSRGHAAMD